MFLTSPPPRVLVLASSALHRSLSHGREHVRVDVCVCACSCVTKTTIKTPMEINKIKGKRQKEVVQILGDLSRTGAVVRMSRGSPWDGGNENTASRYPGHVGVEKLKKRGSAH